MKTAVLLSVLWAAVAVTALAVEKSDDAQIIQGTWLLVNAELGGGPMKEDLMKKITLKLGSGKYEVSAESPDKGTYKMDPASKPKTIDICGTEGPNAGKTIPAIYELNGDTLRVCYGLGGAPRPTEFKTHSGTQTFLATYKRKQK